MAGQPYWGNAGDSTNAYIVRPKVQKEIFLKTTYKTLIGRLNAGRMVKTQSMVFEGAGRKQVDIGNSSIVQTKTIKEGNEVRLTMMEYFNGNATYGDSAVRRGDYSQYKHAVGWVNQIDSPAWQLPGRCSRKQAAEVITNPKGDIMMGIQRWGAEEMDYEWIRAGLMGASRGILSSSADGALGITLPGASAGQTRSCYNFYTPDGVVTPNRTRATHEAAVDTALGNLTDQVLDYFDMGEHDALVNLCDEYYMEPATLFGREYKGIYVCDRALVWRLAARSGTYETLMKDARERGKNNPAINHLDSVEIDGILYIPYRPLEKFNPTANGGTVPTYGPGLENDPRTHTNSSNLRLGMLMGAKSFVRGQDMRIWVTTKEGDHGKGMEYAIHWDEGFVRIEWDAKDGRTEMENPHMFVTCHYDSGVGGAIGT